jgi:hypothetical protein
MLDEILEFFDRRKHRPQTERQFPSQRLFNDLAGDDTEEDGGRRHLLDEDHDGRTRHHRSDRRARVEDWD